MLFVGLLTLTLLGGMATPVWASATAGRVPPPPVVNTDITFISPPDGVNLGSVYTLLALLHDVNGNVLPGRTISFNLDNEYLGQAKTNDAGFAVFSVNKPYPAGDYTLTASFKGERLLAAYTISHPLTIRSTVVRVQTVPAVEGISLSMDGRQFTTGPDGSLQIPVNKAGTYHLAVDTNSYPGTDQKIEFGRWLEEAYAPSIDLQVPTNSVVQVGLNIYHQVGQTFVDLDGKPIDQSRISSITIKSAQGDVFTFQDGQPQWIPASRVARRVNGLEETKLLYSVISVSVDGSNVVNQAQQKFMPNPNDTWSISLLLYSLKVNAKDALFGSPVGKSVMLEASDGQTHAYPLDALGNADINGLARGIYQVQVTGVGGVSSRTPVALSRNQEMNMKVITSLDIGVVAALGIIVALGLLLFGRPWLLPKLERRRSKRLEKVAEAQGMVSIHDN